jgi:hypothetical protein
MLMRIMVTMRPRKNRSWFRKPRIMPLFSPIRGREMSFPRKAIKALLSTVTMRGAKLSSAFSRRMISSRL